MIVDGRDIKLEIWDTVFVLITTLLNDVGWSRAICNVILLLLSNAFSVL